MNEIRNAVLITKAASQNEARGRVLYSGMWGHVVEDRRFSPSGQSVSQTNKASVACYSTVYFLSLLLDSEFGSNTFLKYVGKLYQAARRHIPEVTVVRTSNLTKQEFCRGKW